MDIDDTQLAKRKKRRKRRLQIAIVYIAMAIGLSWFFESQATTTIIFVRHAEKEISNFEDDPELTSEGKKRVFELTRQLKDADVVAGIDAIYSTSFKRNMQTAQPIARALGLNINIYEKKTV